MVFNFCLSCFAIDTQDAHCWLASIIIRIMMLTNVITTNVAGVFGVQDKGKKSSKRATRSVSRSRSPPARSRGKDSGRSRRNDRSRSPSLDDEARKRAKEERYDVPAV